ncbi:hypothetical protein BBBOND_0405250 [Babesia bigemina]|uniref:Uncharacterized protein n=1 Tax=Babesia bigemina TaxID=5866 RepID=A0A061DBG1_BABBI|nr:hypothetical protein BBBOND_0405250 [Babesia bigemina]CDR98041.1 hypothetical protein BBBOND_0405250 [Babesia bigemina]|eukprot:XP_012770227.1 hypothetical protein BBBOND_0405250 [Babesia bigemina]
MIHLSVDNLQVAIKHCQVSNTETRMRQIMGCASQHKLGTMGLVSGSRPRLPHPVGARIAASRALTDSRSNTA